MLRTFQTEEEIYKKFKAICFREGMELGEKLNELIKEYIKTHGEGNPIYPLDKWQDQNFKICPAFFENFQSKWVPYINNCNKDELQEIIDRAEFLTKNGKSKLYQM